MGQQLVCHDTAKRVAEEGDLAVRGELLVARNEQAVDAIELARQRIKHLLAVPVRPSQRAHLKESGMPGRGEVEHVIQGLVQRAAQRLHACHCVSQACQ